MPRRLVAVTDPADPRVADYVGLSDAALRRRFEDVDPDERGSSPHGRFIAEGLLVLEALLASPYPIRSVLSSETQLDRVLAVLDGPNDHAARPEVLVASQAVLDAVVGFAIHRGVVASADRLPVPDPVDLLRSLEADAPRAGRVPTAAQPAGQQPARPPRVAVLEGLNDHENLGVLFRNAAAFDIDAVLLDPRCADPLYRRTVRVSLGHALRVPFARFEADAWPGPALDALSALGYEALAFTPHDHAAPIETHHPGDAKLALLFGAEGPGLTPEALGATVDASGRRVRISIADGVDSLNVATAAAIAFHWAQGQENR